MLDCKTHVKSILSRRARFAAGQMADGILMSVETMTPRAGLLRTRKRSMT